jgi:transcriptional regulator with XRE-family HTH domain
MKDVLSKNLTRIMTERKCSCKELSEQTGLTYAYIYQLLTGKYNPHRRTVRKLATALNVTIKDLIGDCEWVTFPKTLRNT